LVKDPVPNVRMNVCKTIKVTSASFKEKVFILKIISENVGCFKENSCNAIRRLRFRC